MISPTPTQQQPEQGPTPESKKVVYTPPKRAGQSPTALFFKGLFRPVLKGLYYLLRGIANHKLVTLIVILLFLASATLATYISTGQFPLGIASDPFNFHIHGTAGGGDQVKNWLYALRDGDTATISLLDKDISQPPDPSQLVTQYSQPKAHLTWKTINIVGVYSESDSTIDSIVEIDLSATGPGGTTTGILIWHFVTVAQNGGIIINVNLVDFRAPLQ